MREISFKQSDRYEKIGDIARKLAGLGFYSGPRTQEFDKKLHEAIAAFQAKHTLPQSGMCDAVTWRKLDEEAASTFSESFRYELDALRSTPPPAGAPRPNRKSSTVRTRRSAVRICASK